MRYYIKIDRKGHPVSGSLVYTKSKPNNGRWFEIERICPNEDGLCIQPPKPDGYFQRLKYYYVTDECCHPIAGSNIVAYCPPTGNYFEYFPACLVNPCPTNPPLSISVYIIESILCYGAEATLEVIAEGGFPPYTGTGIFTAFAGSHSYSVSDSHNTVVSISIVITQPSQIAPSGSYPPITVNGGTTTIEVTAGGGIPPYTYSLNGGTPQSSGIFPNILAGIPYVIVTDANDCYVPLYFNITQPDPLVSTISILREILCYGDLAQIEVTAVGGTPPYTGTGIFNIPAQPGDYYVAVTDYYGNSAQQTPVQITQPALLVIEDVSYTPIPVYGDTTDLTITASGGVSPYTYSVNGTTYGPNPITNVGAGSFTVYVKDANNCITTTPLVITQPPQDFAVCPDCSPVLGSVTNNGVGLLSVGNMTSSTCTLGNYVIDWYLDNTLGTIQFTSGNTGNTDAAIQQFHPFTGASARPSLGGSWIPVIRYAYFDGIKYTSVYTPGAALATDLEACLDPIIVLDLNCNNGTNANVNFTQYSHRFAYTNGNQVASDASKSLVFTLNTDGTTDYLAWYFQGVIVSDRIKFTYVSPGNSTSTLLQDFVVGTDLPATDFTGITKKVDEDNFRYIIDFTTTTYTIGDYILIDIIAGFIDPNNSNTNWVAYFKCLTTFDTSWTAAARIPCSASITFNPATCLNTLSLTLSNYVEKSPTDIWKYLSGPARQAGTGGPSQINPVATDLLSYSRYSCGYGTSLCGTINYNPACIQATGTITHSRVNNIYTLVYTDITEYNRALNDYNAAVASLSATYSSDPADINHYKFYEFFFTKYNNNNCGDTRTFGREFIVHYNSTVTFDLLTLTLTVTAVPIDASAYYATLPANDCKGTCASLVLVAAANSAAIATGSSAPVTTGTDVVHPVSGFGYCETVGQTTVSQMYYMNQYYLPYYPVTPIPLANNWASEVSSGTTRIAKYMDYRVYTTITDISNPTQNFYMQDYFPPYSKIYEISGGVVTIPSGGCP